MIEKDYLMKQLHQLLNELRQKINTIRESKVEDIEQTFDELYKNYFSQKKSFFLNNNISDIVNFTKNDENKLSFLSELMLEDAKYRSNNNTKYLLQKSLQLLKHIDKSSATFSMERFQKIEEINNLLNE